MLYTAALFCLKRRHASLHRLCRVLGRILLPLQGPESASFE